MLKNLNPIYMSGHRSTSYWSRDAHAHTRRRAVAIAHVMSASKSERSERPSMCGGTSTPAMSRNVGARSMFRAMLGTLCAEYTSQSGHSTHKLLRYNHGMTLTSLYATITATEMSCCITCTCTGIFESVDNTFVHYANVFTN